jgi:hypothetical protein
MTFAICLEVPCVGLKMRGGEGVTFCGLMHRFALLNIFSSAWVKGDGGGGYFVRQVLNHCCRVAYPDLFPFFTVQIRFGTITSGPDRICT